MPTLARLLTALLRRTPPVGEPLSDSELLSRFAKTRDAAAFELLVWRHGSMVLGVCQRILRHEQSAEDAFQAVFLILAKKAGGVRTQLAGWLHTTARRVCLRMAKRTPFAVLNAEPPAAVHPDAVESAELAAVLDAEIARLPEKFRLAVILCYLRGLTTEQAAEQLNVPRGTVLSRLATARKRLVERLTAKGVTVPAAFLTTAITTEELAADVCGRTATAAVGFVTSKLAVMVPSQLATEVLNMTTHKTAVGVAVALVLLTGVGTGLGWVLADGDQPSDRPKPATKADQPKPVLPPTEAQQREEKERRVGAERAERMKAISDLLDREHRELDTLRKMQNERNTDSDAVFLRKANEELLVEVARQVFAAEAAVAEAKFELDEAEKAYRPIRDRKAEFEKVKAELVALVKQHDAAVDELNAAKTEVEKLAKVFKPDAPKLTEAKANAAKLEEKAAELDRARQSLFQKQQRLLYPPVIRFIPKGGRGGGGVGGRMEITSPEVDKKLAEEEARQLAVDRCQATLLQKQAKLDYLKKRQDLLIGELAKGRKGDGWKERLDETEIEIRIERVRKLRQMYFELELQKAGLTRSSENQSSELEDLRREVKRLQTERK